MNKCWVAEVMSMVVVRLQGLFSPDLAEQMKAIDETIEGLKKQRAELQAKIEQNALARGTVNV